MIRLAPQPVTGLHLGAQPRGARLDDGQGGGEQRADMDEIGERAGLDEHQRRRPPGHRLERRDEAHDRPLLSREPRPLTRAQRFDQADAGLGRGDVGLRRLDAGGDRSLFGAGAERLLATMACRRASANASASSPIVWAIDGAASTSVARRVGTIRLRRRIGQPSRW
jgi:hypothetical protein